MLNPVDKAVEIFDPIGALKRAQSRIALKALDTAYRGASRITRTLGTWLPDLLPANTDLDTATRQDLISRSRDAFRNQPAARAAINRTSDNAVGTGLDLQVSIP